MAITGLQIKAGSRDYKSEQERLQIGAALGMSNRGEKITNWAGLSNWGKKFQIGTEITN